MCVLRVGGTNCDAETEEALDEFEEAEAEVIHINRIGRGKELQDYDALIIPGGFSYGDHIRAGAVFAKRISATIAEELRIFVAEEKPVLGICNGFQVLIEAGILPGFEGFAESPMVALAINKSVRYECRWVYLRSENDGNCIFTRAIKDEEILNMPVAHKEGRFVLPKGKEDEYLEKLIENDQLVFRYTDKDGKPARGKYPLNPNGSFYDIAGICDPSGTIFGLMPHPERANYGWQRPDWTKEEKVPKYADGRAIFKSLVDYLQ